MKNMLGLLFEVAATTVTSVVIKEVAKKLK